MTITIETKNQTFLKVADAWDYIGDSRKENRLEITLEDSSAAVVLEKDVIAVDGMKVNNDIAYYLYDLLDQCFKKDKNSISS